MPSRPQDPNQFPTWANDIAARLRAVERKLLNPDEIELLQTYSKGDPLGDTLNLDFVGGLRATLVGDRYVEVAGGGKDWATVVVAAADTHPAGKDAADFVCTGADDQITLNEASESLPITGGKVVLLEGTYNLTGTWNAHGLASDSVHIQGMGGSTILKGSGAATPVISLFSQYGGISHIRITEAPGDAFEIGVSDGYIYACMATTLLNEEDDIAGRGIVSVSSRTTIWGCWAYGTVGNGIEVNGSQSKVVACDVQNCEGKGIYTTGGETFHSQCRVQSVGGKGIHTTGSRGVISDCIVMSPGVDAEGIRCDGGMGISNCYVESAGGGGFFAIRQGSSPSSVVNCRVVDAVEGGIYAGSSNNIIAGNSVHAPAGVGIQTDSSDVHIVGNRVDSFDSGIYSFGGNISDNRVSSWKNGIHVRGNQDSSILNNRVFGGFETTDTYDGIRVEGDQHNVQGNMVRSTDFKYGINVIAGATDCFVTNNDLLNSAVTASFNDAGTGTVTAAGNRL